MSVIYYLCIAENQKILFEGGETSKYGRWAEFVVQRLRGTSKHCFEVSGEKSLHILCIGDVNTLWVAITDNDVSISVPLAMVISLQQPWRSLNRPLQFSKLLEEKITLYSSYEEEVAQTVLEEIREFSEGQESIQVEPITNALARNERLEEVLRQIDKKRTFAAEDISKEWWLKIGGWMMLALEVLACIFALFYVVCGLSLERC